MLGKMYHAYFYVLRIIFQIHGGIMNMSFWSKYIAYAWLLSFIILSTGCASVDYIGESYTPTEKVDLYFLSSDIHFCLLDCAIKSQMCSYKLHENSLFFWWPTWRSRRFLFSILILTN